MIRSIRGRLTLVLVGLLFLGLLGVAVSSVLIVRGYLSGRVESGLKSASTRVVAAMDRGGPVSLTEPELVLLLPEGGTAVLIDAAGRPVLTTGAAGPDPDTLAAGAAHLAPLETIEIGAVRTVAVARIPTRGLTVSTAGAVVHAEAVIVAVPITGDRETVRLIALVNLVAAVLALTLMGFLAALLIRVGLRPLTRMAATADAVAAGRRDLRLPLGHTGPETERLAAAVNHAFDAQRRAEDRLRTFVADASHELRTPLATVNGWVDLYMQGGLGETEDLDRAMVRVEAEVGRMRLLVDELSLLARLDAARPLESEEIDVVTLAGEVVQDARVVTADREITLTGDARAVLRGDGPRLQQVLRNLVGNAVQHTPGGTPVTVDVSRRGDQVVIGVRDAGEGIAPEHLAHVFERFYRAEASRSREGGGSGLGLAIVEAIAAAHGGTVTAASTLGAGTTVTVTLPATARPA